MTSAAPASWIAVMGSSRNTKPRKIVATGPTVPSIEAWLEPMSRMPTDMKSTGRTVETIAMRKVRP